MITHGLQEPAFWAAITGVAVGLYAYVLNPSFPSFLADSLGGVHRLLLRKYGFDDFNDWFFARGARRLGGFLWRRVDVWLIDGLIVNGAAKTVAGASRAMRLLQSGYVYHYAFVMVISLATLVLWWLVA